MKTKVAIYTRVSTMEQDYERQINELTQYATALNYEIVGIYSEKESGAKKRDERPELSKVMNLVEEQKINKILVWELSRFSRDSYECPSLVKILNENCVSLFALKENFETLDKDCKTTIAGEIFMSVMMAFASNERKMIKERLNSGYTLHRAKGGRVGRRPGYEKEIEKTKNFNEVSSLLKGGMSIRGVMKLVNVSQITVYKIKRHLEETKQLTNSLKTIRLSRTKV